MAHKIDAGLCIGCSACSTLCPVFAITGERGNPFVINDKRCVDCGVCSRICPKSAIEDQNGNFGAPVKRNLWPKPEIDKSLCTACGICIHWCTSGALDLSRPEYQGDIDAHALLADEKKCTGCGLCSRNCPMDAIRMVNHETT